MNHYETTVVKHIGPMYREGILWVFQYEVCSVKMMTNHSVKRDCKTIKLVKH